MGKSCLLVHSKALDHGPSSRPPRLSDAAPPYLASAAAWCIAPPLPTLHRPVARCRAHLCWTSTSPRRSALGLLQPPLRCREPATTCQSISLKLSAPASSGRCYQQVSSS